MNRFCKLLLALALLPALVPARSASKTLVLRGARVIDGTGRALIENAALVIEDGKICEVGKLGEVHSPEGSEEIDLSGKTLMPLLIDLHVHLGQTKNGVEPSPDSYNEENLRAQLDRFLAYGVGTVVVLGTD